MATFQQELQELLDEVRGIVHAGEPWNDRVHHIVREAFDVIGKFLQSGEPEAAEQIESAIQQLITDVSEKVFADRRFLRMGVDMASGWLAAEAVGVVQANIGNIDGVLKSIAPALARWENTIHRIRVDLDLADE